MQNVCNELSQWARRENFKLFAMEQYFLNEIKRWDQVIAEIGITVTDRCCFLSIVERLRPKVARQFSICTEHNTAWLGCIAVG